jgi:hypothetical protein
VVTGLCRHFKTTECVVGTCERFFVIIKGVGYVSRCSGEFIVCCFCYRTMDQPCANLVGINTWKLDLRDLCVVTGLCRHFETMECVVGICERFYCNYKGWGICIKVF